MRIGRLHARLDRLTLPPGPGRIMVIYPDSWSAEAQVAYDAACLARDTERQAVVIVRETGEAVEPCDESVITVIEIRVRVDGPA